MNPPTECANCGAEIPPGAKACPECGADERTGWRETSVYDGMELPDDDARSEKEKHRSHRVNGIAWYWWLVGLALLFMILRAGFGW